MKKLLTFFIALMTISSISFGANMGNVWTWKGSLANNSWQNPANWVKGGVPYPGVIANPASNFPGDAGSTEDEVYFDVFLAAVLDFAGDIVIDNVPNCTLGGLEVTYTPGQAFSNVCMMGQTDGVVITMLTPSTDRENYYGAFWFTVKINESCIWDLDNSLLKFANPFNRVKLYAQPGAHVWQKNLAYFYPASYQTCNNEKGFWLQSDASKHAEFIQQELTTQTVEGWVDYILDDNKYHYICPPITSSPFTIGILEFGLEACRKPNSLCIFEQDYVRRWSNQNQSWDIWLGNVGSCFSTGDPDLAPPAGNPNSVDIQTGRGYEYYGNPANPNTSGLYTFYGYLNTGNPITLPVTNVGWNFIGNPFASAIQFGPPSGQNTAGPGWTWASADINPIAYWWNNSMGVSGAYQFYNWFTGIGNGPVLIERRTIPRSQAFFVYNNIPGATVKVGNEARFFRGAAVIGKSDVANYLTMTLLDQSGNFIDNAIVSFKDDAEGTNFDDLRDAFKMAPIVDLSQVYFKTTDNVNVAAKTLKLEAGNIMYPLYFKAVNSGTYSLDARDINTFIPTAGLSLKDNKTNTVVDLRVNPVYTFEATAGDDDARFSLYFANVLNGINNPDNTFRIYSYENTIFIQSNDLNTTGMVMVYDMIGKQITQENLGNGITRINTNLNKGFYIVSVTTNKGVYTQKVYVN